MCNIKMIVIYLILILSGYHKSREAVANFYSQSSAPLKADVSEWAIFQISLLYVCIS